MNLSWVLRARCPVCGEGKILNGLIHVHPRCLECGHDFYPESGYFLGAMFVSFLVTGMLTIPPMIWLKVSGASMTTLMIYPFVQYLFVGSFLMLFSRVFWIHLDYRMTTTLKKSKSANRVD